MRKLYQSKTSKPFTKFVFKTVLSTIFLVITTLAWPTAANAQFTLPGLTCDPTDSALVLWCDSICNDLFCSTGYCSTSGCACSSCVRTLCIPPGACQAPTGFSAECIEISSYPFASLGSCLLTPLDACIGTSTSGCFLDEGGPCQRPNFVTIMPFGRIDYGGAQCTAGTCDCFPTLEEILAGIEENNTGPPTPITKIQLGEGFDITGLVTGIYGIVLPASVVLGIIIIVKAGYILMTSQGDPRKVGEGKEELTAALMGLLFVILTIAILRILLGTFIMGSDPGF